MPEETTHWKAMEKYGQSLNNFTNFNVLNVQEWLVRNKARDTEANNILNTWLYLFVFAQYTWPEKYVLISTCILLKQRLKIDNVRERMKSQTLQSFWFLEYSQKDKCGLLMHYEQGYDTNTNLECAFQMQHKGLGGRK